MHLVASDFSQRKVLLSICFITLFLKRDCFYKWKSNCWLDEGLWSLLLKIFKKASCRVIVILENVMLNILIRTGWLTPSQVDQIYSINKICFRDQNGDANRHQISEFVKIFDFFLVAPSQMHQMNLQWLRELRNQIYI